MASEGNGLVPPYDQGAEEALLGGILLKGALLEDVANIITPADFYNPSHKVLYGVLVDLWSKGLPTDVVSVVAEFKEAGTLDRVGGVAGLMVLQSQAPSTSVKPMLRYASIVVKMALYRRAIMVAENLKSDCYSMLADPNDLMEEAKSNLESLGVRLGDLPTDLWQLDAYLDREGVEPPFWCIPGIIRVGWRVMVVAGEGVGKALALDTVIPSPDGWTTMEKLHQGDRVFDLRGNVCRVTHVTEVQNDRECFEVRFSDGSVIVADADHRWLTHTVKEREHNLDAQVRTTSEIGSSLRTRSINVSNHSIPTCGPLDYPGSPLPVDPYLLGIWLGDGASRGASISTADPEIVQSFENGGYVVSHTSGYDYRVTGVRKWDRSVSFKSALVGLNLIQNKHIPTSYLQGSVSDRRDLLQGLMDSDGYVDERGSCEFCVTNQRLAEDTFELIVGMGHKATINESAAVLNGSEVSRRWRITFRPKGDVFRLERKLKRQRPLTRRASTRYITDVVPVPSVPVRCIQVDSPDSTYLAGESCIPTHNTVLFRQMAIAAAQGIHPLNYTPITPCRTLIVDLENPEDSVMSVCMPIREKALRKSADYDADRAWLWHRPSGINLRERSDRIALESIIEHVKPDLVCMGPLYKAYEVSARENDELAAREVMSVFDKLRARYGFGLLLEHHAPKESGGSKRKMMPYGSSLWLRWPEIGISLNPLGLGLETLEVGRWRGDRLENAWPTKLHRSQDWPFAGEWETGTYRTQERAPDYRVDDIPDDIDPDLPF